jgi:hypothetical protein
MKMHPDQPETWSCKPYIIGHDVGHKRDRSTAVVAGRSPFRFSEMGLLELRELKQGLYGSARASALATVDRQYGNNALIVADLSNDSSYGEILHQTFGRRVIGLHITHHGDGMNFERRPVGQGAMLVYTIGRSHLIEQFHTLMADTRVRFTPGPESERAFAQLADLEMTLRPSGKVYSTLPGHHDDLGISCCMVAWAFCHPHLPSWVNTAFADREPRPRPSQHGWRPFVC